MANGRKNEKRNPQRPMKNRPSSSGNNDNFDWMRVGKVVLGWLAVIIIVFVIMNLLGPNKDKDPIITFRQYQDILDGKVKTLQGQEVRIVRATIYKSELNNYTFNGFLNATVPLQTKENKPVDASSFNVVLGPLDSQMQNQWLAKGIEITYEDKDSYWYAPLVSILPWILIIGVWLLLMRRMQGVGTRGIFSFGKSRAKMLTGNQPRVTFSDVAGADEAKMELSEVIEFLKEPTKFQRLGGKIPRGVLLLGPPGTGKTLLARAVAGEAAVPFFTISGADFVEMFVGVGASRVRDLFDNAKKNAPCIVFIDEIDAVGRLRGAGLGGGHDEREQTLNQLLVEMDGFEQNSGVIIIAATNRPDILDPALLRPGRFDRQVVVDRPDVRGREGILKVHTRNIPLEPNVSLETLAKGTPGLAGAELANLVNEAALLAARKNKKRVSMDDFEEAKDKVMMGMERKSLIISDKEKITTAYHEAGHVLVAKMLPEADPVHKVTIIPRGRALGVTTYLPIDEKHTYSKEYLEAMIAYAMGGRAAEKIIFNQLTTGAGNDIERATNLARKMVCEWGMSENLGPLTFGKKQEEIFLGREIAQHRDYSEQTAVAIDKEVHDIVNRGMELAETLLRDNIDTLKRLADELLVREILDSDEIDKILRGEELPPFQKASNNGAPDSKPPTEDELLQIEKERSEKIKKAVEEIQKREQAKEQPPIN